MRYLVTGCAGFIASRVSATLLADGHEVVGVDNLNDAYDCRLKDHRLAALRAHPQFRFHHGDIARLPDLAPVMTEGPFQVVLNLAARAGVRASVQDPWVYVETNVQGTLNVLEMARRHDIPTVLSASTSSLYGHDNSLPFREDARTDRPLSPYAASKKAAESMAASYTHLHRIHTPVCRYFTVYGPAGRPDMSVFRFVQGIVEGRRIILYGDGTQTRDFTYVDDIARGTILAADLEGHEVVNLGNDAPASVNQLVALIEDATGRSASIERRAAHRADVPATWADISKARELLGWSPKVGLEEGIRNTVQWYLENRDLAKSIDPGAE